MLLFKTKVKLILFSYSSGSLFCSVNHTFIFANKIYFETSNILLKPPIIDQIIYSEQMFIKLLNFVDNFR